jgi:hypothetical protein
MFGEPSLKIPQRRIAIVRTPIQAPNANAYAERWVGSGRRECLDRLLIFGRRQFEHVLRVYIRDFNRQHPHRALDLRPPERRNRADPSRTETLLRRRSSGATSSAACSTNTKPRREERICAPHAGGSDSMAKVAKICHSYPVSCASEFGTRPHSQEVISGSRRTSRGLNERK